MDCAWYALRFPVSRTIATMAASPILREILEQWHAAVSDSAVMSRTDHLSLARDALALGHPNLASEILRESEAQPGAPAEVRYVAALAAARIGALRSAQSLIDGLLD